MIILVKTQINEIKLGLGIIDSLLHTTTQGLNMNSTEVI